MAGAQARKVLLDNAAAEWKVPVGELTTEHEHGDPRQVEAPHLLRRCRQVRQGAGSELPKIDEGDLKKPMRSSS